jgi:hypothetical protein
MAVYGEGGGGIAALPGFRRKALGMLPGRRPRRRGPAPALRQGLMQRAPIMGEIDPGFNMQLPGPQGGPEEMLGAHIGPPENTVTWGGKTWQDPNKLWGWIAARGGGKAGNMENFFRMHPDAARRLGMDIEEPGAEVDPMDPNQLKRGLINQLSMAQGAIQGGPAQGLNKVASRRLRAVGAAQGRAHNLAKIMARKLRGRGGAQAELF